MLRLLNFAAFYAGWFACVVGAAHGLPLVGPAVVLALVALHLRLTDNAASEARLIVAVGALGWVIDSFQGGLGVFAFTPQAALGWLCPPWLVGLWVIFATTLNGSMRWLAGRYIVAAALGAGAGPISYYYGVRLGAIIFPHFVLSVLALAVVWAIVMPVLLWLAQVFTPDSDARPRCPVPAAST